MNKKKIGIACIFLLGSFTPSFSQLTDGMTGLLHMPNAEMQKNGNFMLGGNFLNSHNLPNQNAWGYDTYDYYLNITFFKFLEVGYICTLFKGKDDGYWPEQTWGDFTNQDRHFSIRMRLVSERQWWRYMPAVVVGVNDFTTGSGGDYTNMAVDGNGNGYFNRYYIALTKHFDVKVGELGTHFTYLYNERTDYPLNGPAFGINFRPHFYPSLNFIAEYDAKTINVGATYSIWNNHFNFLFELRQCKYISAGLVYKVNLLGGNQWKKWK